MKKKLKGELAATQRAIKERVLTLVLTGLGLVAALAWNDAIVSFFNALFPKNQALVGKFLYALLVTVVVVIISQWLNRLLTEREEQNKKQ